MKLMKRMTEEQVRRYIAGEPPFDPVGYEREHILRLVKSGEKALAECDPAFYGNLEKTVERWAKNHKNTPHAMEYAALLELLERIRRVNQNA